MAAAPWNLCPGEYKDGQSSAYQPCGSLSWITLKRGSKLCHTAFCSSLPGWLSYTIRTSPKVSAWLTSKNIPLVLKPLYIKPYIASTHYNCLKIPAFKKMTSILPTRPVIEKHPSKQPQGETWFNVAQVVFRQGHYTSLFLGQKEPAPQFFAQYPSFH